MEVEGLGRAPALPMQLLLLISTPGEEGPGLHRSRQETAKGCWGPSAPPGRTGEERALGVRARWEGLPVAFPTCLFPKLQALGCGCVAQAVLSKGTMGGAATISVGFAMAVTLGVYVAGGISGGHINPAVSFAMCLTGKMKWAKLPVYVLAQYLGAFLGSVVVFGINYDALISYTGGTFAVKGPNATAHIFATYPQEYLSLANGFADQMISTAFLILGVFAILDTDNLGVPKGLEPIAIGLLIILLTSSMALNSGCAMNPARDLGPRLFTSMAGWGSEVFTTGNNWWWVPIAGPMVGAALGAATYLLFIEIHHFPPSPCQKTDPEAHEHELAPLEEGK